MSSLVPETINGTIEFFRSKNTPWSANAVSIGTTSGAVTSLATKVVAAQTKLDAQIALRQATKNATVDLHQSLRELTRAGGDIIKQIRAKAAIDGAGVYVLAQIPPPAAPSPVAAPGTPTNFTATLREDGSLLLKWKCANPVGGSGTIYQISRQLGAGADMILLGASGKKSYIDASLPASADSASGVTYQITAIRSTVAGAPAQFTVKFGIGGGGAITARVVSAPRMAA